MEKEYDTTNEKSTESEDTLDSESENCENPTCSSKRRYVTRFYSKEWELQYKWLKQDEETKRPFCIACKQLLVNQKNHLYRHSETKKHIANLKQASENSKIQLSEFLPNRNTNFRKNVAVAEIKIVLRAISKNQSFKSMDGISKFNSLIFPDSNIAKSVSNIF